MNPDPIYRHIGTIVRDRRKLLRITQDKLARRLAISRASLANIETGRQRLLVHQLYRLAGELGLRPSDLLPAPEGPAAKPEIETLPLPTGLKPKQREQIARLFEAPAAETAGLKEESHGKQTKR
jgi:transcriptional regulator with XRE-family HTH domain